MSTSVFPFTYPFQLLQEWISEAKLTYDNHNINNYNAAVLSTVSATQQPSSRVVLIKEINDTGLIFYTNLGSKKAQELQQNSSVSLVFYWELLHRQIRIEGIVEPVSSKTADLYFASRPFVSKVGAWASKQSQKLHNREELEHRVQQFTAKYEKSNHVPRPDFWSGYQIIPHYFEFWEEVNFRLHNRVIFTRTADGYKKSLLYP